MFKERSKLDLRSLAFRNGTKAARIEAFIAHGLIILIALLRILFVDYLIYARLY